MASLPAKRVEQSYEELLQDQLQALKGVLLQKHHHELRKLEKCNRRLHNDLVQAELDVERMSELASMSSPTSGEFLQRSTSRSAVDLRSPVFAPMMRTSIVSSSTDAVSVAERARDLRLLNRSSSHVSHFSLGSVRSEEGAMPEGDSGFYVDDPVAQEFHPYSPWSRFVLKLLERGDEGPYVDSRQSIRGALKMRSTWKVSVHDGARQEGRYKVSVLSTTMTHRINDAVTDDSCLQRFVCVPQSPVQLTWSFLASIFILWDVITMPLEMFGVPWLMDMLDVASWVTFSFWTIDIPLHFFFGIQLEGALELRPCELARIYLRSWFWLDVMVVLIDIFVFLLEAVLVSGMDGTVFRSARYLRVLRLLRLFRLIRVFKLTRELTLLANRFLSTHAFMVMKIVAGLSMMIAMNHLIACSWYGLASMSEGESWVSVMGLKPEEASFADAYAASMHWALTQFTPATNNIAPISGLERFFAIWIILLAMGVFSSFIGSITTTVSSLRSIRAEHSAKQSKLLQFFIERDLSVDLFSKVQEALRREGAFKVRSSEKEVDLMRGIPERFKIQLHEEMYALTLVKFQFWPDRMKEEDQFLIRLICHEAMEEAAAPPGQDIFLPGGDCAQAYIMQTGVMSYQAKEHQLVECTGEKNSCLCMITLWADWYTRGRLTALNELCYYVIVDAEAFCTACVNFGGNIFSHLQIFGIFLVGHIEVLDEQHLMVTDLPDEKILEELKQRAISFADFARTAKRTIGNWVEGSTNMNSFTGGN